MGKPRAKAPKPKPIKVFDRKRLDHAYTVVCQMYEDDKMSETSYMKAIISLAHDWAVLGDFQESLTLVGMVSEDYIQDVMPEQMIFDTTFGETAHKLAKLFVKSGAGTSDPPDKDFLQLSIAKSGQA